MHPRSKLSQAQREQAVELFEQGYGARAVSNRLGGQAGPGSRVGSVYMADFVL